MNKTLEKQLQNLPTDPGIYKYFDTDNELIYVGKAVNLKNRVKSYFTGNDHSPKTRVLVSRIDHLETIVVQSEVDALILEANLIKEFRPRYNIILKDDKSHLYIKVTLYEDLPRVSTCRQTDMVQDPKAAYFGPFPSSGTAKQTLRYLRRVFPYVARHQPPVPCRRRPPQSFFYYNLPLGPVDSEIDKKQYRQQIFQLVHFLEGKRLLVADELEKEMKAAAKDLQFEQAAAIKQQLDGLAYVSQQKITPETYLANPEFMAEKREQGLRELAKALTQFWPEIGLDRTNTETTESPASALHRIECYDISNISGQQAVGSMVVFDDGEAKKSDYRKFRIKRENKPNDFAMLQEVLNRRLRRLQAARRPVGQAEIEDQVQGDDAKKTKPGARGPRPDESFGSLPDLIIVDGGKGQLSAAVAILDELGLDIPVVGMTKREEELIVQRAAPNEDETARRRDGNGMEVSSNTKADFFGTRDPRPETRNFKPKRSSAHGAIAHSDDESQTTVSVEASFTTVRLARGSEALFLIQRIRDEAHRFAITYHRKLRGKAFLPE